MKNLILTAALAATLVGCASAPAYQPLPTPRPAFPVAEYDALDKTGKNVVTGQVFLKTRGGDVKTGAGNVVYLEPKTSYKDFDFNHREVPALERPDPRFLAARRETIADASGRFTFKDVPDGAYYLSGSVFWETRTTGQGHWIYKQLVVRNGEVKEVMLTE